ncbi:MAG: hypothetical protein WC847_00530 [Candidatus Paceibacterota bacterium]|jgi:DNA-binding beta-propeller fold protein YncE
MKNFFKKINIFEQDFFVSIKKILYYEEHHLLRFAFASLAIFFVGISGIFLFSKITEAAAATFIQSSWAGGITVNVAADPTDQTGWTEYDSANGVTAGATVTLGPVTKSFIDGSPITANGNPPTGGGFSSGLFSSSKFHGVNGEGGWVGALNVTLFSGTSYAVGGSPKNIAFDSINNAVWVTNNSNGTVIKLNASTGFPIGVYPVGANPQGIAFDSINNAIWVTNTSASTITKVDGITGNIIGTYVAGTTPYDIVFDAPQNAVWVTDTTDNTVSEFDTTTGNLVDTIPVGNSPQSITYDSTLGDESVWIANYWDNTVSKINTTTGVVSGTYAVGGNPTDIVFDVTNSSVWVSNYTDSTVTQLNESSGVPIGTYPVGTNPSGIIFDVTNNAVWVTNNTSGTVTKLDATNGNTIIGTYSTGTNPEGVVFDITSNSVWIVNNNNGVGDGSVTKLNASNGNNIGGPFVTGAGPYGIAYDAPHNAIWVANSGANTISEYDASTSVIIGSPIATGNGPQGVAYDATNHAVWTPNITDGTVTKIDTNTSTVVGTYAVGTLTSFPQDITFDVTQNAIWVSNHGDNAVVKLDAATGAPVGAPIAVGNYPQGVAFDVTNNAIWVANNSDDTITKVDAATGVVIGSPIAVDVGPMRVAYDITQNAVWVTSTNSVSKIDATTGVLIGSPISVAFAPRGIAFDITNNTILVTNNGNTVTRINAATGVIMGGLIPMSSTYPENIAYDITNNVFWVTDVSGNKIFKIKPIDGSYITSAGSFVSAVIDFTEVSQFTTFAFTATTPINTGITMDVRGSVDNITWTSWITNVSNGGSISALTGNRYIQYRANLTSTDATVTPTLSDVSVSSASWTFIDDEPTSTTPVPPSASGGDFTNGTNSGTSASWYVYLTPGIAAGTRTDYSLASGFNPIGVAFDNVTNSVWVAMHGSGWIEKMDINTGTKVDYPMTGHYYLSPWAMAFDNVTNSIWVTEYYEGQVSKVNVNDGTFVDYNVGAFPQAIAFDNVTNSVWVTNSSDNTVSKVDITAGTKVDYATGTEPIGVAFDNFTNSVWVANFAGGAGNTVSKININTGTKVDYSTGTGPYGVAFDNVTNSVWVTNMVDNTVTKINATTGATIGTYGVGSDPRAATFDNVTNSIWVTSYNANSVNKINVNTGTSVSYGVGWQPWGIAFDNVTNSVWVGNYDSFANHPPTRISKVKIMNDPYVSPGTFTSAVIDFGAAAFLNTISFSTALPANTNITIDLRAGNVAVPDGSWTDWAINTDVANGGDISALSSNRYIQYRANLTTTDGINTPDLYSVTFNYYFSLQRQLSGDLTSSVYDAGSADNTITKIAWSATGTSPSEIVKFQVRSSPDGATWSNWCGPSVTCDGTDYFLDVNNDVALDSGHPLRNGADDEFFQYKVFLAGDGSATPTLTSVTISYDVTPVTPPPGGGGGSFAVGPTSVSGAATSVTVTNAILNGTVNANGATDTMRYFEWGTAPDVLSNQTPHIAHTNIPSGTTATLSWSNINGATLCKINGGQYVDKVVSCTGGSLITDTLTTNTTYILMASNGYGGEVTKSLSVIVP